MRGEKRKLLAFIPHPSSLRKGLPCRISSTSYISSPCASFPPGSFTALTTGKYRRGLWPKFIGRAFRRQGDAPCIWFHGVSVGEIHLLQHLVAAFRRRHLDWHCVISTTTDTGFAEAEKHFPGCRVFWWPLDFTWAVKRALRRVRPDVVVLAEGELWPNFLSIAKRRGVRLAVVNGRLSPRSLTRYQKLGSLARRIWSKPDLVAAQTGEYAHAYQSLGAKLVRVTGSLKYDGAASDRENPRTRQLGELLGVAPQDLVWIAGSTQAPEEQIVLDIYRRAQAKHPNLRLLLKEFNKIDNQSGDEPKQFVTHPKGRKMLVQAGKTVMFVELEGIASAPGPELQSVGPLQSELFERGVDFGLAVNLDGAGGAKAVTKEVAYLERNEFRPTAAGGQLSAEVLAKVKRATVYIRVTMPNGGVAQGSGFFGVEPGLVLTNAHVLGMLKAESPAPKKVEVVYKNGEPDSRSFTGKILGVDRSSDLAVLRVQGDKLPEPLEVKSTTSLVETQVVYVFGFPFGDWLGKNMTVSPSSVTSLRKGANGETNKVQVNGGMQPGNSGGPVVDAGGAVVGVAVSGIEGTQINFAVPGEYVHVVLNGRISGISTSPTVRDGDKLKMRVNLAFLDPLNRVKKVSCEWWTAPDGKSRPATDKQPAPLPGDSPHQVIDMTYASAAAHGDIILPPNLPQGHRIFAQPVVVNGTGKPRWAAAVSYEVSSPVDKLPALLTLKHYWAPDPFRSRRRQK